MNDKNQEPIVNNIDQIFERIIEKRVQKLIDRKIKEIEYFFTQQNPDYKQKLKRFFTNKTNL